MKNTKRAVGNSTWRKEKRFRKRTRRKSPRNHWAKSYFASPFSIEFLDSTSIPIMIYVHSHPLLRPGRFQTHKKKRRWGFMAKTIRNANKADYPSLKTNHRHHIRWFISFKNKLRYRNGKGRAFSKRKLKRNNLITLTIWHDLRLKQVALIPNSFADSKKRRR